MTNKSIPIFRSTSPPNKYLSKYLLKIEKSGRLTNFGPLSMDLESRIQKITGRRTIAVTSGTVGLYLALAAANISEEDDAVILPSFNFAAGLQAIIQMNKRPLFVDIDKNYCISLDHLRHLLKTNSRCSAVIAVNYYGWAGNPKEVEEVVRKVEKEDSRRICLIFDSAHAFGASYYGRPIGSYGDFEVFSFSATKVIGGAEGGAVTCSNSEYAERLEIARNYGTKNYHILNIGTNGKLSEPNAAYILARMDYMKEIISHRSKLAHKYFSALKKITSVVPPYIHKNWAPVYKDIIVQLQGDENFNRANIRNKLWVYGIDTRAYFWPPLHLSSLVSNKKISLPCTEDIADRILALPFYDELTTDEIEWISEKLEFILSESTLKS